jgi:hypothetical protein
MHFDPTISLGSIVTLGIILISLFRIDRKLSRYDIEHEILMTWYCRIHEIRLDELPTRTKVRP